jgi:hypothetical protein
MNSLARVVIATLQCCCRSARALPRRSACYARNYERAWRYIDLRSPPSVQQSNGGPQLARQLEKILDHDVRFDVASLSGNPKCGQPRAPAPNCERVAGFQMDGREVELDLDRVTVPQRRVDSCR